MSAHRRHVAASAAALALLLAGCGQSPTEVYVDMTTAAQMGDQEGFLKGFTKDSRKLVKALISLSEAYGMRDSDPYRLLVFDTVDHAEIRESGDRAVLHVRRGGLTRRILMVRENDAWRIDVQALETFWKEEGKR